MCKLAAVSKKAHRQVFALLLVGGSFAASSFATRQGSGQEAPRGSLPARDTTPPRPLSDLEVAYPQGASGETTVVLTLTVEPDGSVSAAAANESHEPFSSAAVAAAVKWQFQPAIRRGVAVRVRIR